MKLATLIQQLQELQATFTPEEIEVMGEPEIHIDVFEERDSTHHTFKYAGISPDIKITPSEDGVYYILTAFKE